MKCYNLDGIITELKKRLDWYESACAAWKKVEFVTKKDGKPFTILSKNIRNATIRVNEYSLVSGSKKIGICTWTKYQGWITDDFALNENVRYLKYDFMLAKKENYMPKEPCLEEQYMFDLEDIKFFVSERIKNYENQIEILKEEIRIAGECYTDFKNKYADLMKEFNEKLQGKSDLFYLIKDTVIK